MKEITTDKLISALDSVTWYNGLAETLLKWKDVPLNGPSISCPLQARETADWYGAQLQVMWMICVELFGDCGTSPRFGWINGVDGFRAFIDRITRTYRESDKEDK